jgi:hypothetical protein
LGRARRRRAEDYRACGALAVLVPGRSTRTLGIMKAALCLVVVLIESTSAIAAGPSLGKVTDIVIEESGNSEPEDPQTKCDFKLSIEEVDSYLNNALIVVGHHYLRWSPCYVKGVATIEGMPAFWVIRESGIGYIKFMGIDYDLASQQAIQNPD